MKCPDCQKELGWIGDNDTMDEDVYVTHMGCADCNIEVDKYWGEGVDKDDSILFLPTVNFQMPKTYEIDFDKVDTLDDVINILEGLNIKYTSQPDQLSKCLMPYLKESDDI